MEYEILSISELEKIGLSAVTSLKVNTNELGFNTLLVSFNGHELTDEQVSFLRKFYNVEILFDIRIDHFK